MNALQRFVRSRVLLLTAAILIVTMGLSVLVQGQSQASLDRTVDENSRGLYDILVQAKAGSGALLQPEIANGTGGISFDQLNGIRDLAGTSIAAPISLVSRVTQNLEVPRLDAMDYLGYNPALAGSATADQPDGVAPTDWPAAESVLTEEPKKYRVTASAVSSDGASEQTMFKSSSEGTLGKSRLVEEKSNGGTSVQIEKAAGETGIKFPSPAGDPSTRCSTSPSPFPWPRRSRNRWWLLTLLRSARCSVTPVSSLPRSKRHHLRTPGMLAPSDVTSRASSRRESPPRSSKKAQISWASNSSTGHR